MCSTPGQGGPHPPGQLLPLGEQGHVQRADKPLLQVALGGAVADQNQFHGPSPFKTMGRPQKIRSTRSARFAKRQHSRPTCSRRLRCAGSTGTTPQPTSSQMRITSGLAASSAGLLRGAGHLLHAVPGLFQGVVQLALARAADDENHTNTSIRWATTAPSTMPSSQSWRKNPAKSPVTPPNCRLAVAT